MIERVHFALVLRWDGWDFLGMQKTEEPLLRVYFRLGDFLQVVAIEKRLRPVFIDFVVAVGLLRDG